MRFYVLSGDFCDDGSQFFLEVDPSTPTGEAARCDVCGNYYGLVPFKPPIRGTLVAERSIFDFARAGDDVFLSERCVKCFLESGVRGLGNPTPVELLSIEGPLGLDRQKQFFLADVVPWGGELDRVRSGLRTAEKAPCPACGYAGIIDGYDGIHLIESSWRGDDIFRIKGLPGAILVSERLEVLCREQGLSVCSLVPAEKSRMGGIDLISPN